VKERGERRWREEKEALSFQWSFAKRERGELDSKSPVRVSGRSVFFPRRDFCTSERVHSEELRESFVDIHTCERGSIKILQDSKRS